MIILLAYLGGVLTILSPCILPVLPFVFARAGQPFVRSGLPMLLGMAITFAIVATLAAVGGGWAVQANQYGRYAALALLGFFGLTLVFPAFADRLMQPLVAAGSRLSQAAESGEGKSGSIAPSFLLGAATGLLWAPCAGPILGLVLTGAALQGANTQTSLLLVAYAAGAATSLALALLIGGKVFTALKRSLGVGEWVRRGLGLAVIVAVIAIALGLDTGLLTQLSRSRTASVEQALVDRIRPLQTTSATAARDMPSLAGATAWINSPPLTAESLRGKVVLVDIWTYSCINCLRTLPYVRAWAEKYRDQGLVVIGVHAPEFAFEKNIENVRKATQDLKLNYPVAIDNDFAIWRGFGNQYWPAHYFIDAQGLVRHHQYGEGHYEESEALIQQLLKEAGAADVGGGFVKIDAAGAMAPPDDSVAARSPETYVGHGRAKNFASPGGQVRGEAHVYTAPEPLGPNQWAFKGNWTALTQSAWLTQAPGSIVYRFHARDLHLVLGPGKAGKPVRFRVNIDGAAPGDDHGADIDAQGQGIVDGERLYQLVRQRGEIRDRTFEIEFLDPAVEAFAFTFG